MILKIGKLLSCLKKKQRNKKDIALRLITNATKASFFFEYEDVITVSWGDDTSEIVSAQNVAHVYNDARVRVVTIRASSAAILRFGANYGNAVLSIDTTNAKNLRQLTLGNNGISELNVLANTLLNRVEIMGNPLVLNDESLTSLVESLPDRSGQSVGTLRLINPAQAAKVQNILTAKNWQTT